MTVDVFQAMAGAAGMLFQWQMLFYIVLGVGIGTILAVIPGVGG